MDQTPAVATERGKPLSQSRKATKRRDAILRAAIEIINVKGYSLATMSEIAASLDLRDATLYYYYPNKQALVFACHVHSLARFECLVDAAIAADGSGAARLRGFVAAFFAESHANGPQLYFGEHSYLNREQRDAIDSWGDQLTVKLQSLFEAGLVDGSIGPCEPELVVQLLLGMFIWLAKWVPVKGPPSVERMTAAVDACILRGLSTDHEGR